MYLRHLEYFVAVVQQGSILKAARKLNLSQPSLSVAMKQLEQELQTVLFERGARHIRLTETGKRLSERAENHGPATGNPWRGACRSDFFFCHLAVRPAPDPIQPSVSGNPL